MYNLYSKFDIQKHKDTYVNYLEIVIYPDGHIEYAIPSHQEKLIKIACHINNWNRSELNTKCPKEYYCDFLTWLCNITGCISVWDQYIIIPESGITKQQYQTLLELKNNQLYFGDIPE